MEAGAVVNPAEKFRHKNRLQEFAQRALIPLPVYQTFNEGTQHKPQFRSTVIVDGTKYISPSVFLKRKEAEQYVAKFALEGILTKIRQEGVPLINNDAAFCKTILHEYAAKMKKELPKYTTSKTEGLLPTFITTVVFDGRTYSGDAGRSIREGEQLGARRVIGWILGQSDTGIDMAEIIKSKGKLFDIFRRSSTSVALQDNKVLLEVSGDAIAKDNNVHTESTNGNLPAPAAEPAILPAATNPEELHICGVHSGTSGGSETPPTLQTSSQPEGPTDGPVNPVPENPCPEQVIQVKEEVPLEDPPPRSQGDLQTPNPASSGKRSRKRNKKGSNSKKMRPDE